jgi:hypothetical protein
MKKLVLLTIAAATLSLFSCNKERTCECKDSAVTTKIPKGRKSDQKTICSTLATANGTTCELK